MKSWLFRLLFPKQLALMKHAAKYYAEQELGREYRKKFATLQRSPLDESVWVRKFAVLDADYAELVREAQGMREEIAYLARRVRELGLERWRDTK